ncbi:phage terminase large subunit [Acidisphaera sp. L21]|uniref:phage terminase large subunit n=1 Tax=Acidisphaera sp. L21 TaxID=1641851 RepID=UPI00131D808D|nr:phage terminase large subunit [Acidisphaera sp. L21]
MPTWTPSDLKTERTLRKSIRADLTAWATLALAPRGQTPAAHHRLIIAELERLADARTDRLMLLLPPGSAKSTYASLVFPPWWLARHPKSSIIATSHTASLARHFGRGVRGLIEQHAPRLGYTIDPASHAAHRFATTTGAEYYATGVRGPITGRRADLILIDDPVKSQAEADSPSARDQLWAWFRSDLVTRLKPGGRILLVMTRWHPDDLGGRILEGSDPWRVLRLPALAEPDDPLGREPGAPLWPEWEDATAIARKRTLLDERTFAALFQQDPRPRIGRLFHPARIMILEDAQTTTAVRAWDLAASAEARGKDPDFTVGLKLARDAAGAYIVLDIIRFRGGPHEVEQAILATAAADGVAVAIGLPQDPGQAGRSQIRYFTSRLAGFRVIASPETGSKETRAMPAASQVNAGNMALRRAPWNRTFLEELQDFPNGAKDDQVDALSRAMSLLTDAPAPARRANLPLLSR